MDEGFYLVAQRSCGCPIVLGGSTLLNKSLGFKETAIAVNFFELQFLNQSKYNVVLLIRKCRMDLQWLMKYLVTFDLFVLYLVTQHNLNLLQCSNFPDC